MRAKMKAIMKGFVNLVEGTAVLRGFHNKTLAK